MFCVVNFYGEAVVVANTLHGAKCYATRHGYRRIGRISAINNMIVEQLKKDHYSGRWAKIN